MFGTRGKAVVLVAAAVAAGAAAFSAPAQPWVAIAEAAQPDPPLHGCGRSTSSCSPRSAGTPTAGRRSRRRDLDDVATAMSTVGTTVGETDGLVDGIAAAVDGSASLGPDGTDTTGRSAMAERLRSEATGFLAEMRR
ncbi:hypothetical protein ACI797_24865 [Geodermatophilus sp. SYSU D00691]